MHLDTLLFQIQTMLFAGSCLLLAGSVIGLYLKGRVLSEESITFFTGNEGKSEAKDEGPYREKRSARRVPSRAPFELMNPMGEYMPNSARLYDMSLKGACFDSTLMIKPGKHIQARLHSTKEGLLQISARVVWLKPRNNRTVYGIEFDSVHPAKV
jgi:hypothetical protein